MLACFYWHHVIVGGKNQSRLLQQQTKCSQRHLNCLEMGQQVLCNAVFNLRVGEKFLETTKQMFQPFHVLKSLVLETV